jgi:hypothetical protein
MTETNYGEFDDDVSLDADGKKFFGPRTEWLKMTKGQILRAAFLYFHTTDVNAVSAARGEAKKEKKTLTTDEMKAVANKALEAKATELSKSIDQLTAVEKLDLSTVHFKKMYAHYQQGLGFVLSRLGKDGPDADNVWKKLPESKLYFTTLLLVYPTTQDGDLDKEGLKSGNWKIIPWRFGKNAYEEIWNQNEGLRSNGLSIATQDLKLECKDQQYQNIKVSFIGKALWQQNEKFKGVVLAKAVEQYTKLVPFRELTTAQLREKLGIGGGAVQDVSGEDLSGLLDNV